MMACYGKSNILFLLELVKEKDFSWQLVTEFDNMGGKTIGLLLQILKSYFATGYLLFLILAFTFQKVLSS